MGRAFEYRKDRKFKRWAKMSQAFTRIGKEISMAVKAGGPNPEANTRLKTAIQNARGASMPKDRVEAAIKRATSKDEKDYEEVVYEGYGPGGIAVVVETATDNSTRTVANIRMYFNRSGGSLGKTGSLDFLFERKGIFRISVEKVEVEELELELIDYGAEEVVQVEETEVVIQTAFEDFGTMQKGLEEKGFNVVSAQLQRIPTTVSKIDPAEEEKLLNLIEKIEEDEDVQAVYHNMEE